MEGFDFVQSHDVVFSKMKASVQELYGITERIENNQRKQDGLIISNVDSIEEFTSMCDNEHSNINEEIKKITPENETLELHCRKVGTKVIQLNLSSSSGSGLKKLEIKLRQAMKEKYNSKIYDLKEERSGKKVYFMKANKSFIQRKKGQLIYKLVDRIKQTGRDCKISWVSGQLFLNESKVKFVRSPGTMYASVTDWDEEHEEDSYFSEVVSWKQ